MASNEQADRIQSMHDLLLEYPYMLVEFKPCLGYLFRDILRQYEYWAYADIDMILGRIDKLLPMEMLSEYDVISVTFGDPYILYLRGQLTIHRNDDKINNLWRLCDHFVNVTGRLSLYESTGRTKWPFQSAEGCYSHAVLMKSNASVFIATVEMSDAFNARLELREAFLIGKAIVQCHSKPIVNALYSSVRDFLEEDRYLGTNASHRYRPRQSFSEVRKRGYRCIYRYWFDKSYEVCDIQHRYEYGQTNPSIADMSGRTADDSRRPIAATKLLLRRG